jgi:hypothetical protein
VKFSARQHLAMAKLIRAKAAKERETERKLRLEAVARKFLGLARLALKNPPQIKR